MGGLGHGPPGPPLNPALVLAKVFGVGGSNGALSGSIKSNMATDGYLGYTKLAMTWQSVSRST